MPSWPAGSTSRRGPPPCTSPTFSANWRWGRGPRWPGSSGRRPRREGEAMGSIRGGTAGWTDKTLLDSGWYPKDATSAQARLGYYATRFPLVEVDSTYYSPPAEQTAALWVARTPPGFVFNIKAFSLLTGHPTQPAKLYKD